LTTTVKNRKECNTEKESNLEIAREKTLKVVTSTGMIKGRGCKTENR
jgi:hypothetical protein